MSELAREPGGCRCLSLDDATWHATECWTRQVADLTEQLARTHAHLEAQRLATYQAVKREHAAGRELARLKDTEKFIQQLAEIRKARHEATASPDTP